MDDGLSRGSFLFLSLPSFGLRVCKAEKGLFGLRGFGASVHAPVVPPLRRGSALPSCKERDGEQGYERGTPQRLGRLEYVDGSQSVAGPRQTDTNLNDGEGGVGYRDSCGFQDD